MAIRQMMENDDSASSSSQSNNCNALSDYFLRNICVIYSPREAREVTRKDQRGRNRLLRKLGGFCREGWEHEGLGSAG